MMLNQKKIFTRRNFEIRNNALFVEVRNLISSEEKEIPFEEINVKRLIKQSKRDILMLVVCIFFSAVTILNIIINLYEGTKLEYDVIITMAAFALLSFLIGYTNHKKIILVPTINGKAIVFFNDKSNKIGLDQFIAELNHNSNTYLKNKYGSIDRDLPVEQQLNNLLWLKEREVINSEEFENLKLQLLGKSNTSNQIGFRNN